MILCNLWEKGKNIVHFKFQGYPRIRVTLVDQIFIMFDLFDEFILHGEPHNLKQIFLLTQIFVGFLVNSIQPFLHLKQLFMLTKISQTFFIQLVFLHKFHVKIRILWDIFLDDLYHYYSNQMFIPNGIYPLPMKVDHQW